MTGKDLARGVFFFVVWLIIVALWAAFVHWGTLGFALGGALVLGRQCWQERGT